MAAAARRPSALPVASTTQRYLATGSGASDWLDVNPGAGGDAQLRLMTAKLVDLIPLGVQDHRNEQAQFAIAQHGDCVAARNVNLVEDFAGRRERFGEDRPLRGDFVGHEVEVGFGQVKNSWKAPGWLTMPRTVRCGQWRPRPWRHHSHWRQARLISPATRRPRSAGVSQSTTSATNSCPGVPANP